jgi:hypothetical protein
MIGQERIMRGIDHQQADMFSYLSPEQMMGLAKRRFLQFGW